MSHAHRFFYLHRICFENGMVNIINLTLFNNARLMTFVNNYLKEKTIEYIKANFYLSVTNFKSAHEIRFGLQSFVEKCAKSVGSFFIGRSK